MRLKPTLKNRIKLGGQTVEVKQITIAQWRQLFTVVETLPQLIISILGTKPDERAAYLVVALEQSLEEITHVVSVLTGLDAEYIEHNASITELVAYFTEAAKVNDFAGLLKNVRGVLALSQGPAAQAEQDAN
ncbi:hypothetical protein D1872_243270 [compost metagenome]